MEEAICADDPLLCNVDTLTKEQWHGLLNRFSDASIYQSWSYGEVRWGPEQLSHFVCMRGEQVVAAAQVRILRLPVLGDCIAYVYRGPMYRFGKHVVDSETLRLVVRELYREYIVNRGLMLRVVPNEAESENSSLALVLKEEGFRRSTRAHSYRTIFIDLTPDIEELHRGLSKKWRENLRRANRGGLTLVEGMDETLFDSFFELYRQMHSRKKFVQFVDVRQFRDIQSDLPEQLKLKILLCEKDGEAVSALVYTAIGDTGIPLFSATGDNGLKLRGSYLLRWNMLENLKRSGYRVLDQGGINKANNPGGYHFKSGMGGRETDFVGVYECFKNPMQYILMKSAELLLRSYRTMKTRVNRVMSRTGRKRN